MKVEVSNLRKHFGRTRAVDGISFRFAAGQVFGFVGPNGAGKTTTMRILATLDEPTEGDAMINGVSVTQYPEEARRMIGFVPDSLPEHGDMTSREYLDFFARAYGLKGRKRRAAVEAVEEFANLTELREKMLKELSKGMKQRLSLGRALIHDPAVLIMDEPAAGLDPRARVELRELLGLLARQDKAILISSHILTELTEICNGVIIIERGKLLEQGTIAEVSERGKRKRAVVIRTVDRIEDLCRRLLEMPGVGAVNRVDSEVVVEVDGDEAACSDLLAELVRAGFRVAEFRQKKADLEDIFMSVTKGEVQ